MFKEMVWDELGIAIDGEYAALWFGYRGGGARVAAEKVTGLGVTYDQAVAGLSGIFSIDKSSSTILSNKWRGISADKKIRLELFGTSKDISEANLSVAVELESDKKLSPKSNPPF